jgi:hypothetical protein
MFSKFLLNGYHFHTTIKLKLCEVELYNIGSIYALVHLHHCKWYTKLGSGAEHVQISFFSTPVHIL